MTAPLVSAEVDLRDFAFLPLDVLRLRDSDLACVEDAEVFRCAVLSWCVSWHQVPAASLPDEDALLARLLGFGRDVKGWKRVRAAGGMRGWQLCDDGRLYHPVVAELAQRARTEAARRAREEARQRQSQPLSQTKQISVTEPVTASKGQGQGQGQGQGDSLSLLPPVGDGDPGPALRAAPEPAPPPPFDGNNAEALNGKSVVPLALHWELPEPWGIDAEALGFKPSEVLHEAERFRQYWVAGKGAGTRRSVKGWRQTWSTWLGKAARDHR
jgi:hypothetical protein